MIVKEGVPSSTRQQTITDKQERYIPENEAELAQEYDEWFDSLSDDHKLEHLKYLNDAKENTESENRETESDSQGESKTDVSDQAGKEKPVNKELNDNLEKAEGEIKSAEDALKKKGQRTRQVPSRRSGRFIW